MKNRIKNSNLNHIIKILSHHSKLLKIGFKYKIGDCMLLIMVYN